MDYLEAPICLVAEESGMAEFMGIGSGMGSEMMCLR